MKRGSAFALALVAAIGLAPAGVAAAPEAPSASAAPAPSRLIRSLHRLQQRMTTGDAAAQSALGALVADLQKQFDAADPVVWSRRAEAAAQMALLLSGGETRSARQRLESGLFTDGAELVAAGVAFAEGARERAAALLDRFDPRDVPDLARAQAALAAATLAAAETGAQARLRADRLFDAARMLAPGALPEEAALRRQTALAEREGDSAMFVRRAEAHLRRFPASVYAPAFRSFLTRGVASLAMRDKADSIETFAPLLARMAPSDRLAALEAVARAGLERGRFVLSLSALRRILETEPASSPAASRASMMAMVANALDAGPDVAARLRASAPLDPETDALRGAALGMIDSIYVWPPAVTTVRRQGDADEAPPPHLAQAEATLARGEALLADPRLAGQGPASARKRAGAPAK